MEKYFIIWWVVSLGVIVLIFTNREEKTAWWYLDRIVEKRIEKKEFLNKITDIDKEILEYKKIMDNLQYSWLDYPGFTQEIKLPQRTWTEAEILVNQSIE